MLLCSVLAALITSARAAWRRRRRAEARADEIALLAATVQRWRLTPAEWGGAKGDGFEGVSLESIGATACPLTGQRRTSHGVYTVAHVPAGPVLDRALARVGRNGGADGVLVIGRDPETFETSAAIVLGPLLQVPLATVPWHLVTPAHALEDDHTAEDAAMETALEAETHALEVAEPGDALEGEPTRRVRRPRAADREPLALTLWPAPGDPPRPARGPTSIRWPGAARSRGRPQDPSP